MTTKETVEEYLHRKRTEVGYEFHTDQELIAMKKAEDNPLNKKESEKSEDGKIEVLFRSVQKRHDDDKTEKARLQKIEEGEKAQEERDLKTLKCLAEKNLEMLMQQSPSFKSFIDRRWTHEDARGDGIMCKACDSIIIKSIPWSTGVASGNHLLRLMRHTYLIDIWEQQSGEYSDFSWPVRDSDHEYGKEFHWLKEFKDVLEKLANPENAIDFFLNLKKVKPLF